MINVPAILNEKKFPSKTNKPVLTPLQIKTVMNEYINTPDTIDTICEKHGIESFNYYQTVNRYPEIYNYFIECTKRKTEIWAQQIIDIADNESKDLMPVMNENGEVIDYKQNPVKTRRDDLRIRSRIMLIERLNKRYSLKTQQEVKSVNLNINKDLPPKEELDKKDTSELLGFFQSE